MGRYFLDIQYDNVWRRGIFACPGTGSMLARQRGLLKQLLRCLMTNLHVRERSEGWEEGHRLTGAGRSAQHCNTTRVSDPGFFQIPDPGVCTSNGEIFSNVYKMNVLDTIKRHLFCFYTFVVRRPLKALEPRIRIWSEFFPWSGSGALALTGDIWHQKYKNKKGVFW